MSTRVVLVLVQYDTSMEVHLHFSSVAPAREDTGHDVVACSRWAIGSDRPKSQFISVSQILLLNCASEPIKATVWSIAFTMTSFEGKLARGGNRRISGALSYDRTTIKLRYEGSFNANGKPHGKGKMKLPDGSLYEGDFSEGEIQGSGLRTYLDSSSYSGMFHEGERHGQGLFLGPNPVGAPTFVLGLLPLHSPSFPYP